MNYLQANGTKKPGNSMLGRRNFLSQLGDGLGACALMSMLHVDGVRADEARPAGDDDERPKAGGMRDFHAATISVLEGDAPELAE